MSLYPGTNNGFPTDASPLVNVLAMDRLYKKFIYQLCVYNAQHGWIAGFPRFTKDDFDAVLYQTGFVNGVRLDDIMSATFAPKGI